MTTTETCWWCEGDIDDLAPDTVIERGELMHRQCRDALLRERELERIEYQDYDPQTD